MSPSDRRLDRMAVAWAMRSLLESPANGSAGARRLGNDRPPRLPGSVGLAGGRGCPEVRDPTGGLRVLQVLYPVPSGEVNRGRSPGRPALSSVRPSPPAAAPRVGESAGDGPAS